MAYPSGPTIAPAIEVHLTGENTGNPHFVFDIAPPETEWEVFTVPLSYPECVRLMKAQKGWREVEQIQSGLHQTAFLPEVSGEYPVVKVAYPGLTETPQEKSCEIRRAVYTKGLAPALRQWRERTFRPKPEPELPLRGIGFGDSDLPPAIANGRLSDPARTR